MNKTHNKSILEINALALSLHLGWPKDERLRIQTVLVDIALTFVEPPKAIMTDRLEDTFCYSKLIHDLKEAITPKHYHLIEHLTYAIYEFIQKALSNVYDISITVTKKPDIPGLTGGITFTFQDRP